MSVYFQVALILVLATGAGCLIWELIGLRRTLGAMADQGAARAKSARETAATVVRAAQDLAQAVEGVVAALKAMETGRAAASGAMHAALVDTRDSLRSAIGGLSGPLTTLATESVDQREVTRSIRDLLAKSHDALHRQAEALSASNTRLAEIVDRLARLASVNDESARLLHRATDELLQRVATEIGKNGEALERLRKTIGDDIARLPAE